jgi:hypothetical protein
LHVLHQAWWGSPNVLTVTPFSLCQAEVGDRLLLPHDHKLAQQKNNSNTSNTATTLQRCTNCVYFLLYHSSRPNVSIRIERTRSLSVNKALIQQRSRHMSDNAAVSPCQKPVSPTLYHLRFSRPYHVAPAQFGSPVRCARLNMQPSLVMTCFMTCLTNGASNVIPSGKVVH